MNRPARGKISAVLGAVFLLIIACSENPYKTAMSSYDTKQVLNAIESIYDVSQLLTIANRCQIISDSLTYARAKKLQIAVSEIIMQKTEWLELHLTAIQRARALAQSAPVPNIEESDASIMKSAVKAEKQLM